MTNAEIETAVKELRMLAVKTAEAVAGLLERTIPQPDPFGSPDLSGTKQTVQELPQDAAKLREYLGTVR